MLQAESIDDKCILNSVQMRYGTQFGQVLEVVTSQNW